MNDEQLIEAAKEAREHAHAPYSNYFVVLDGELAVP